MLNTPTFSKIQREHFHGEHFLKILIIFSTTVVEDMSAHVKLSTMSIIPSKLLSNYFCLSFTDNVHTSEHLCCKYVLTINLYL